MRAMMAILKGKEGPRRWVVPALWAILALQLSAFRPFTPMPSVCPTCPEKGDKLVFTDGKVLVADVIGKNQDGWILQKYGELRFVQKPELSKIDWQAGAEPRGLDGYDHILLKNKEQTVLHGTIIQVEPGKPMALRSPRGTVYTVLATEALLYYQKGARKAPPKDPAAAPSP
jgi:hypothetical protein